MKTKIFIFSLILLLLTACAAENTPSNLPVDQGTTNNETVAVEPTAPVEEPVQEEPVVEPAAEVSFSNDVFPILNSRCMTCHGGERIEGELVMLSYAELMAGGENGAVILPGDGEGSLLYELASSGKMPKRGANLNAVQLATILEWINAGALDN